MIERIGTHVGFDGPNHGVGMSDGVSDDAGITLSQRQPQVLQGENRGVGLDDEGVERCQNGGRELGFVHVSEPLAAVVARLAGCVAPEGAERVLSNADFLGLVDFHKASPSGARVSTPADGAASLPARGREAAGEAA